MPFPFLIGAGVLLSGLAAIGGHMSAKEKNEKAQRLYNKAKSVSDDKVETYNSVRADLKALLDEGALNKAHVLNKTIPEFKKYFNKIKNVDEVKNSVIACSDFKFENLESLSKYQEDVALAVDKANRSIDSQNEDSDAASGLGAILGPGAVAGYGAVTGLMAGGIGGAFSGALAASLTSPLAIVAAPLFLVSAFKADSKADENLEEAKTYALKIESECKGINLKIANLKAIGQNAKIYGTLLLDLEAVFVQLIRKMGALIKSKEAQYHGSIPKNARQVFTPPEGYLLKANWAMCQALDDLVHAPLYDKELMLDPKIGRVMTEVNEKLSNFAPAAGCQRSGSMETPAKARDFRSHSDEDFATEMIRDIDDDDD